MYSYLKIYIKLCLTWPCTIVLRLAFWSLTMNELCVYPVCLPIGATPHDHDTLNMDLTVSNVFCDYTYPDIGIFRNSSIMISKLDAIIILWKNKINPS